MTIIDYINCIMFFFAWLAISFFIGITIGKWLKKNEIDYVVKSIENNWIELQKKRIK